MGCTVTPGCFQLVAQKSRTPIILLVKDMDVLTIPPTLGEDPAVIQKILAHLDDNAISVATALLPDCRASPSLPMGLFD